MKILYLIPPSEWKIIWWVLWKEELSFNFRKPLEFLESLTENDLKCSWKRYEEALVCHKKILLDKKQELLPAIERYSGVMYKAIDYEWITEKGRMYFDTYFFISSGLYGLLKPQDMIVNYKLPIEVKWLALYWKDILTQRLRELKPDIIVDFLPESYKKMIDWKYLDIQVVHIDFYTIKDWFQKKLSHGVKKVKGEYIKNICEKGITDIADFPGYQIKISDMSIRCKVFDTELL